MMAGVILIAACMSADLADCQMSNNWFLVDRNGQAVHSFMNVRDCWKLVDGPPFVDPRGGPFRCEQLEERK